ncbi:MAG: hypothetical protein R3357_06715 [Burkholderiales bacterium]|nr:hypothetical protein [Burkholderiales bacterium]
MIAEVQNSMQVFDDAERAALRREWLALVEVAVWGGAQSRHIGAPARLRRRVAELGERLAALDAPREWIPRPRERLKSALAGVLAARESLAQCAQAIDAIDAGATREVLVAALQRIESRAAGPMTAAAGQWARALEALNVARVED